MIFVSAEWLLVGAVATVGVLHTIVPDHWVPITLIARQRGWSTAQTARASLLAGTGHVLSTLAIASVVWIAGVAVAKTFGHWVDTIASIALILFGGWIAISSLLAMRRGGHGHGHGGHSHSHGFEQLAATGGVHGPELQRIETADGPLDLSIYELNMPPHFRLTGAHIERASAITTRPNGTRQDFPFRRVGEFWQSIESIPEPHGFEVLLKVGHGDHEHTHSVTFKEHEHGDHGHDDHDHHDHSKAEPGKPKTSTRTALLLILGSSPMVEGIPAFFAAGRYGPVLIIVMSLVFALTTIVTYVVLCVGSVAGLQRVSLGPLERYGEVLSGGFIALVGLVFWVWPVL